MSVNKYHLFLLATVLIALALSAVGFYDAFTWFLEVAPILIAIPLLIVTYQVFRFSTLTYTLIALHALVLIMGARYTYAQVPLGFWLQDLFDLSRNPYDRIGHFMQGFVPAMIAREILLRRTPLGPSGAAYPGWLFFIVCCIALSISACYEFVEWWVAVLTGESAEAFLGTQGDVWDTQWDMMLALVGATVAQFLLRRAHDRQLSQVPSS